MSNEALVELLAARRALEVEDADLWHRVTLGELSPEEAAEQRLEGRTVGAAERAAVERDQRLFAPPPAEGAQARFDALMALRDAEATPKHGATLDSTAAEERVGVVLPMAPHRARRWVMGLTTAAAAVVLTVWLVREPGTDRPELFAGGYVVDLELATTNVMGSEPAAEVPTFLRGGRIRIRLVPERAVEEAVEVVVFVWDRAGQARRIDVEPRMVGRGLVEIEAAVASLGLEVGEQELVIAIGRAEALPQTLEGVEAAIAEHGSDGQAGFEVVRTTVRVVERL